MSIPGLPHRPKPYDTRANVRNELTGDHDEASSDVSLVELPLAAADQNIQRATLLEVNDEFFALTDYVVNQARRIVGDKFDQLSPATGLRLLALMRLEQIRNRMGGDLNGALLQPSRDGLFCCLASAHVATARVTMARSVNTHHHFRLLAPSTNCTAQHEKLGRFLARLSELTGRLDESRVLTDRQYVLEQMPVIENIRRCAAACAALAAVIEALSACQDVLAQAETVFSDSAL